MNEGLGELRVSQTLFYAIFKIEPTSVHFLHGNHQILISHDRHFVAEKNTVLLICSS